ncbi:MAG: polyprenyl synthetase family protein [Thermoleophilia bacterium]|nr:polyprenyl synthetase family protein [Thermoleophilia bacterium]
MGQPTQERTTYPDHLRHLIEGYLESLRFLRGGPGEDQAAGTEGLVEAMRYSLLAGGKRIRPVLALATAESLGRDPAELLPTAAAIELTHTYSLIHDDLPAMDDDALRRGRPTCHVVYGEDIAILAGDALFAEGMRLICDEQGGGPEIQLGMLAELSRAAGVGGMVGGQYLDLRGEGHDSIGALRRIHSLKTGRLIACAVRCALVLAQPGEETWRHYGRFAQELGLLFQIVDDILDVEGTEEELGKRIGADERAGKATYVSLLGIDEARDRAERAHAEVVSMLSLIDGPKDALLALADLTLSRRN